MLFLQRLRLAFFKQKKLIFLLTTLVFLFIGLISLPAFSSERTLVAENANWSVTGKFTLDGTYPSNKDEIISAIAHDRDIVVWGSWAGDDNNTGKLVSPPFKAPTILSMFVAGYPNFSGNELFIERIKDRQQLKLKVIDPHERWVDNKWLLPLSWRGTDIRLVAIDGATGGGGWLGVSSPRETNWFSLIRFQISSLIIIPVYIVHFGLFLIPGIFVAIFMVQRNYLNRVFTLIMSILVSSIIAYLAFWIYLLNQELGKYFSIAILCISTGCLFFLIAKRNSLKKSLNIDIDAILPTLLMFSVGFFYISILYIVNFSRSLEILSQVRFFTAALPPDNIIPMLFAERLYTGQDPRNLIGDWLSSDRPPLQTGLILLQRPLMGWLGLDLSFHYQILAAIAQCSWIPAMWGLCRTARLSGRSIGLVMAFSIFSGFFLFNSVYVWPKLLAGAMVIFAFALLLESAIASQRPSILQMVLAAIAAALGMLAHGGAIFTLPAIALVFVRKKYFPGIRRILISCVFFTLLLLPWSAYQKFYEPPGNRLVKWHLGGVEQVDKRSSLETIIDSYQRLNFTEIVNNKWQNLKTLVVSPYRESPYFGTASFEAKQNSKNDLLEVRRNNEYFSIFDSLGILNVGWLISIANIFAKRQSFKKKREVIQIIFRTSLISLLFWVLVMFGPSTTVIHQGSYATMMLLFTGLGMVVSTIPGWLPYFLLGIQIVAFTVTWVFSTPPVLPNMLIFIPNVLMIVSATIAFGFIVVILRQLSKCKYIE